MSSLCGLLQKTLVEMEHDSSTSTSSPQQKRAKLDHSSNNETSRASNSATTFAPPASLQQFLQGKLQQSLAEAVEAVARVESTDSLPTNDVAVSELTSLYCADLLQSRQNWTNKTFSAAGNDLFKAISKFGILYTPPSSSSSNSDNTHTVLYRGVTLCSANHLLTRYTDFIEKNKAVFEDITTHHTDIQHKDWTSVTKDNSALEKYCTAAAAMGEKVWVAEANRFMADYIVKFFTQGGALRHQQKIHRGKEQQLDSLPRDLMQTTTPEGSREKIRVLDVGSCYNPLAHMEGLHQHFDVTAMDLCPAHPSVFRGDFLTLDVLKKDTAVLRGEGKHVIHNTELQQEELMGLVESQFDAVTMSLVLSYLPTPEAREVMVDKARALLVTPSATRRPHHKGLLIIAEKTSILATPSQKQVQVKKASKLSENSNNNKSTAAGSTSTVSVDDWKAAICARGFESVTYQYLPSSDGRKSHLFVFAAVDFPADYDPTAPKPRIHIKQDFYTTEGTVAAEDEL